MMNSTNAITCPNCGNSVNNSRITSARYHCPYCDCDFDYISPMSDHEYQLLDKGIVQFKLGSFVDAFDAFRELSEQYPGNYKAWLGMYVCTLKEKRFEGKEW